jgi:hypothetical protein
VPGLSAVLEFDQPAPFEFDQLSAHRPPAPPLVEDRRVADDVVEVLHGRVSAGVVLVIGPGTADPRQGDAAASGELAEVGVLATVAAVLLAEAAELTPQCRVHGERQGPEPGTCCLPVTGRGTGQSGGRDRFKK